ncbi:MAG: hypothetical protein PHP79_08110 [Clostridia bacterium]|nr:hypothetical protein [Clostridia bacterium]MDD4680828.1 hypothetical protein [Clostridia bacterium]
MDLMEYKARELYDKYQIPAMKGIVVDSLVQLFDFISWEFIDGEDDKNGI